MAAQVKVNNRVDPLDALVFKSQLLLLLLGLLVHFSELLYVFEIRGEMALTADDGIVDLQRELLFLELERSGICGFDHLGHKWEKGLSEVVAGLLGHLCW